MVGYYLRIRLLQYFMPYGQKVLTEVEPNPDTFRTHSLELDSDQLLTLSNGVENRLEIACIVNP